MEDTELQRDYSELKPYQFKKGQSGNPGGKPKGAVSLKVWARNYLQGLTDEQRLEFLEGINKLDIWKMGEGTPETHTDITSNGETLQPVLVKFLDGTESNRNTIGV